MTDYLLVFAWHNIEGTWHGPSRPGTGQRVFERQMTQLRRLGNVVDLASALEALAEGRPLPPRALALTFDDGYRDNLELAVPILERLELPATFFLVPGLLEGRPCAWWEELCWAFTEASRPSVEWKGRSLSTKGRDGTIAMRQILEGLKVLDQTARETAVKTLVDRLEPHGSPPDFGQMFLDGDSARALTHGRFSVGSHSMKHAILGRETREAQREDLAASRRWLEEQLDVPVSLLAYPNGRWGDFDEHTERAAVAAGYSHSLTTQAGRNHSGTPAHRIHRMVLESHRGLASTTALRVGARARGALRRYVPGRPATI